MKRLILSTILAASLIPATAYAATTIYPSVEPDPATAAVIVGGPAQPYSEMVHTNATVNGTTLELTTKPGANNVTVSSTNTLSASGANGNGFATVSGVNDLGFANLTINPTSPFDFFNAMQFTLTPLGPNGQPLEYNFDVSVVTLSGIENILNVAFETKSDKFDVVGSILLDATNLIDSITLSGLQGRAKGSTGAFTAYNFSNIKQISFGPQAVSTPPVQNAIPEPGTWLMMIFGFGAIGGALRRRRRSVPAGRQSFTAA